MAAEMEYTAEVIGGENWLVRHIGDLWHRVDGPYNFLAEAQERADELNGDSNE